MPPRTSLLRQCISMVSPMLTRRYHESPPGFDLTMPVRAVNLAGKNVSMALHTCPTDAPTPTGRQSRRNLRRFPRPRTKRSASLRRFMLLSWGDNNKNPPIASQIPLGQKDKKRRKCNRAGMIEERPESRQVVSSCSRSGSLPDGVLVRVIMVALESGRCMANGLFAVSE